MAKILLTDFIADIRGAVGGTKYNKNTYSQYRQQNVSPVNTNTVPQQLVRGRMTAMAQEWRNNTEPQRQAFIDIAPQWEATNVFGNSFTYSGFNLFGKINRNRQEINEALLNIAPIPGTVTNMTSITVTANTTGGTMILDFAPAIPATQKHIVYASQPVSAGVNFVKSEFRKVAVFDNTILTGVDLAAFYIAVFGALPPIGAKVFVQMRPIVIASGQPGNLLKDSDIAV